MLGKKVISDQYFGIHNSGTHTKNIVLFLNVHHSHNLLIDSYFDDFRVLNCSQLIVSLVNDKRRYRGFTKPAIIVLVKQHAGTLGNGHIGFDKAVLIATIMHLGIT